MNLPPPPPTFLLVFRDPVGMTEPVPAEIARLMAWMEALKKSGAYLASGSLDGTRARVLRGPRGRDVSDGPFVEAKELIGGFMKIAAADFAAADAIAQSCPIVAAGTSIEVRRVAPIDGRRHAI